jgi:hypothetical protein
VSAPAKIVPTRDRYIPQVKAFVPLCDGEALVVRCSILMMRDQATAGMRRCGDEARPVLNTIMELAGHYAFVTMPIERLQELRKELVRLTMCANALERFAYRLEYPEGGE